MAESQRILIVDDETRICESLKELLTENDYSIETASAGREAIKILSKHTFDLILLDIVMPDVDGHQVLRHIRVHFPELIAIIISGHATIESAVSTLKEGAYDYIKKPFEYEELIKRIANALEQKQLRKEKAAIIWELEQSQKQYQYLVQNSPDIIYTLDEQGNFSFINHAFEDLLGYNKDDILGKHYSSIICSPDMEKAEYVFNERRTRDRATSGMELRLKPSKETDYEQLKHFKDQFPIELKAQGIYDRDPEEKEKNFLGTYGVARDIRERKLLETQLQQSEKMEAIGRLAGGIAHDFNNLLAAIVGNIALVKMNTQPGTEVYERMEQMEKAAFRARDLTRQLITFARGGFPVKKFGSLPEIIKEAAAFVLRGSNVRCKYDLPEGLWAVEFDEGQINQVVQNLIINADQAMPDGGIVEIKGENVTITESFKPALRPGRYVRISVVDHGCGIPAEHLNKVFDPFFTTKRGVSGFGLSTSYSIMRSHGGFLDVESKENIGTTFYFYLPAAEKKTEDDNGDKEKLYEGRGRVLVMDDEKELRDVYERILKRLGYTPLLVKDGKEAVDCYRRALEAEEPFNIVIMDLTIPGGMGGKEAVKELLKIDPDAKVIVSSGYSKDPVMANYREYGFKDVIEKPFNIHKLSKILWRVRGESEE